MAQTGKTTGNVKLRSGAGMEFEPPLAFLEPGTQMEVMGEQGDWLHVKVNGKEGYVGKKYVEVSGSADTSGMQKAAPTPTAAAKPAAADDDEHTGMTKHDPRPGMGSAPTGKAHKGVEEQ